MLLSRLMKRFNVGYIAGGIDIEDVSDVGHKIEKLITTYPGERIARQYIWKEGGIRERFKIEDVVTDCDATSP